VRFLGDQGALVSCSADKTVKLWSADAEGAYSTSAVFQVRPAPPAQLPVQLPAQLAIEGLGPVPMGLACRYFCPTRLAAWKMGYTPGMVVCNMLSYYSASQVLGMAGGGGLPLCCSCQCVVAGHCTPLACLRHCSETAQ